MTNFERITASPMALTEFWCNHTDCANCQIYDFCDSSKDCPLIDWLNSDADKSPLTCGSCPIGKTQRIVGNGITEPPYVTVVRCPFDDKFYKNQDDKCTHPQ